MPRAYTGLRLRNSLLKRFTRGFLRGLGADYWPWYRRDSHPRDTDDRHLIDAFVQRAGGAFETRSAQASG